MNSISDASSLFGAFLGGGGGSSKIIDIRMQEVSGMFTSTMLFKWRGL